MGRMEILLILGVVVCAGLVLFALARGLYHFSQAHRATTQGAIHDNPLMSNPPMIARLTSQAITLILLLLLGLFSSGRPAESVPGRVSFSIAMHTYNHHTCTNEH